jgi:hypothetical protein
VCDTESNDPCLYYQDPDCQAVPPQPTEPPGGDPIVCPAILFEKDGVCADPNDPCHLDPDCNAVEPQPPGSTPSDPGTPICKAIASPPDGVCSREPNDPCLSLDPDCVPVACATYIELSDGVCKRQPTDPCIFQDPDCHVK